MEDALSPAFDTHGLREQVGGAREDVVGGVPVYVIMIVVLMAALNVVLLALVTESAQARAVALQARKMVELLGCTILVAPSHMLHTVLKHFCLAFL